MQIRKNVTATSLFVTPSSAAVYHSIWQSHITQCSNLLKCNAGNANFGKVPKPSENSKKKKIKNTKKIITEAHLLHLHALCR